MGQAMFSTYVASTLIKNDYSYWSAFFVALVVGTVLGAVVDLLVMRPLSGKRSSAMMSSPAMRGTIPVIASLGILGILQSAAGVIWAAEERGVPTPVSALGYSIGGMVMPFTAFDLFVIGIVLFTLIITTIFFQKTGMGLAMRASALSPEVARLSGIRTSSVRTLSWAISGAASSLAGLLVTPSANLSPNTLDLILIIGFTATVIGGLDSLPGGVLGGFILGLVISFVNVYASPTDIFLAILAILLIVLLVRPQGILGSKEVRRV
jgi:branched-chain amino acid transport system permease protein